MSPVHVLALLKGAVESSRAVPPLPEGAIAHLGSLLGAGAHFEAACALGLFRGGDLYEPQLSQLGLDLYQAWALSELPATRANAWHGPVLERAVEGLSQLARTCVR